MSKLNLNKLDNEIQRTIIEDDPEAIIITSPGIFNLSKNLSKKFNIPVIEGVTAATALIENFVKLDIQIKNFLLNLVEILEYQFKLIIKIHFLNLYLIETVLFQSSRLDRRLLVCKFEGYHLL